MTSTSEQPAPVKCSTSVALDFDTSMRLDELKTALSRQAGRKLAAREVITLLLDEHDQAGDQAG